jgi:hypothetical protein
MAFDKTTVFSHLKRYKRDHLGVAANGTWRGTEYSHILPRNLYQKNLINAGYLPRLIQTASFSGLTLHGGFHHLNSSQALAFNLFVPLVEDKALGTILQLLDIEDEITESRFEFVKIPSEGTNFDFFMKGPRQEYYFEVKYTETGFGSARQDAAHVHKYETIYKALVKRMSSIGHDEFFRRYQLWRVICYSVDGVVVFVIPKFRQDLEDEIVAARKKATNQRNIKILYIDDVVSAAVERNDKRLAAHYREFEAKYLAIRGIQPVVRADASRAR